MAQLSKYDAPQTRREPETGPEEWYWEAETHLIEPPEWLIDETLPERSVNMLFGEFNLGKTFLALDWAACVSAGLPWMEHKTKKRDVLYVASEGDPGGIGKRMEAWRKRWDREALPLRILFYADLVNLDTELEQLLDAARDRGLRPGLVIVDTLSMAMSDDENSNTAMNQVVKACRRNQVYEADGVEHEITFLLVHHTGWEGDRPRGASSMPAGLDYVIGMKKDEKVDGALKVWLYKAKRSDKRKWGEKILRIRPVADDAVIEKFRFDEYDMEKAKASAGAGAERLRSYLLATEAQVGTVVKQVDVRRWIAEQEGRDPNDLKSLMSETFGQMKDIGYLGVKPGTKLTMVALAPSEWTFQAEDVEDL